MKYFGAPCLHKRRDLDLFAAPTPTSPQDRCVRHAHPSCLRLKASFQIFVIWRILSPSNCITYT